MQGRDTGADNDENSSEEDSEPDLDGIILDSRPVAGESNRLRLFDEGERLAGETVYLNENELGETNNAGALRFTVPNTEEITITTESDLDELARSVEGYEKSGYADINISSISSQEVFDDYKVPVEVRIEAGTETNYSIAIDDEVVDSGELQATQRYTYENTEIVKNEGMHELSIETSNQDGIENSKSVDFETTQSAPQTVDIYSVNPREGETVSGEQTSFEWQAYAPEDVGYEFVWSTSDFSDKDSPRTFEGKKGLTEYSSTWSFSEAGVYNHTIEAVDTETDSIITSRTMEVRYE